MSIFVPIRTIVTPEKAILGAGAAAMQTLAPISGAIRDPRQMMRMAQMLFHSNQYVFKAESTIDYAFGTVDWHLEDADDNEIEAQTANGPYLDALNLMEKPQAALPAVLRQGSPTDRNRQGLTRSQLWSLTARHAGLCGSSFWLADQLDGLAGTPLAFLYINPARMTPDEDDAGNLTGWWLDDTYGYAQHTGTFLSLDEVYHFKLNEPDFGHFGIGLVESFWDNDRLTSLADRHAADVLASGGRLAGIVSAKQGGNIPDNVYQQMVRDLRTVNDQPDSARHMIVMQGPIDFTRTTATAAELDLLALMTMSKEDTYEHWGVPASQIGGRTPAGLNSGDVRKYDRAAMWQNAISPRLSNFWEVLQYQLLDRYQALGAVIELEIDEPEFDDDSPRYDLLQKSINIAMTNAERRALIGLDPLGVPALDDAIYLPLSLVQVATAQAEPDASATAQALGRVPAVQAGKARVQHPLRASLLKLRANVERSATPVLKRGITAFLHGQKREIAARVRSLPPHRIKDPTHLFPKTMLKDWDTRLQAVLAPQLSGMAEQVHEHITTTYGKPAGKAVTFIDGAVNHVLTRGAARVTKINETTRAGIAEIVAQGIDQGLSPAELGDAVEAWSGFDEYRGELIARTELMDAYNAAALGSYDEIGVTKVEAIDGDGDDECAARDGSVMSLEEADAIEDHPNGTLDWMPAAE